MSTYSGKTEAHADGGVDSYTKVTLWPLDVKGVFCGGTHGHGHLHQKTQHTHHVHSGHYCCQYTEYLSKKEENIREYNSKETMRSWAKTCKERS